MTDKNLDQIARRKAIQDTIAENREFFEARMRHHYDEMGLGTWKPRLSAEERAAVKAREAQDKAVAQIKALAEKAGVGVVVVEDPDIQKKLDSVVDGTYEGGVEHPDFPWDKEGSAAEDETVAEMVARVGAEAEAAEVDRRDEDIAAKADAALSQG